MSIKSNVKIKKIKLFLLFLFFKKKVFFFNLLGIPCLVVRTWRVHCCSPGSFPGQGTKILQALQQDKKKDFYSSKTRYNAE